ncbi:MAG TPA: hypothetical protein PKE65_08130 [Rhizobiaceae bacterium]|nr:hypothetical protein [Rhizobiaceae bacterium]
MSAQSQRSEQMAGPLRLVLVDSITQVEPHDAGALVVSGSHGGVSAATFAAVVPALLHVFNDAGIGKERAGVRGLDLLAEVGLAGVAVGHETARIGDARDTLENGVVTVVNEPAAALGVSIGQPLRDVVARLSARA